MFRLSMRKMLVTRQRSVCNRYGKDGIIASTSIFNERKSSCLSSSYDIYGLKYLSLSQIRARSQLPSLRSIIEEIDVHEKNKKIDNSDLKALPTAAPSTPNESNFSHQSDRITQGDEDVIATPSNITNSKLSSNRKQAKGNLQNLSNDGISTSSISPVSGHRANHNKHETSFVFGDIAPQADGSVLARCGDITLLSTVVVQRDTEVSIPCVHFIPLTVEYRQRSHSTGKIPSSRNRRDNTGVPTPSETLVARAIDRVIRPLLPTEKYYINEHISLTSSLQSYNINSLNAKSKI